jgi:PAS domain S-box-containing protein
MIDREYMLEVFKASLNPCFIVLPDSPVFTIVAASRVLLSSIPASESEVLNQSAAKIFSGPSASPGLITYDTLIDSFNNVILTGKTQNVSAWSPDGLNPVEKHQNRYWEGESMPLFDQEGVLRYIFHSAVDITGKLNQRNAGVSETKESVEDPVFDRKKATEKIRDSEEKNRLIMNAALDAIICIDKRGDVTFWNPKAAELFGWQAGEVMGKKLSSFIIPENFRHRHDAGLEKYVATGEQRALNRILELEGARRGGELFPIELTIIPINQPNEQFFCAFIRDISARKKAEENIRQQAADLEISNKELEQFAYVASHDLQEPLRMVTSFLKQIESRYSDIIDDKGKQYIYFAVDGAKRMRQIILDLLEFSRLGRLDEKLEVVDVKMLADESLKLFANQIAETDAIIDIQSLPVIHAYKAPLRQVLQNLLSNALKYQHEDRRPVITISSFEKGTDWEFIVKDNGIGISSEHHERVFVIFQRLHNRDEYSGTGIGLAIVKKIISNMGGRIWIDSEEGKGSAFHFSIPKNIVRR